MSLLREGLRRSDALRAAVVPSGKLRYVNWYLQHGCDLACYYCKVPQQKVAAMNREQRREALGRLYSLCIRQPSLTIIGGEPTLRPDYLVEAVGDARAAGFRVNLVSNGWGLTPELVERLSEAGLRYLAISVDCDEGAEKANLAKALSLQAVARRYGIIPVINTVITRDTDPEQFKRFAATVIGNGCFISPLACSPEVPGGVFSSAPLDSVPSKQQLRTVVRWLAWQKVSTGRVSTSFSYLWQLFHSGAVAGESARLWHCSPHFRQGSGQRGRSYLTLDADGFIGACQEFPRLVNVLKIPEGQLSLPWLDSLFGETTRRCPGCLYNCYIMEEGLQGLQVLAETTTFVQMTSIWVNSFAARERPPVVSS